MRYHKFGTKLTQMSLETYKKTIQYVKKAKGVILINCSRTKFVAIIVKVLVFFTQIFRRTIFALF